MKKYLGLLLIILCSSQIVNAQVYVKGDVFISSGTEVYVKDSLISEVSSLYVESGKLISCSSVSFRDSDDRLAIEEVTELNSSIEDSLSNVVYRESLDRAFIIEKKDKAILAASESASKAEEVKSSSPLSYPKGDNNEEVISEGLSVFLENKKSFKLFVLSYIHSIHSTLFTDFIPKHEIISDLLPKGSLILIEESKRGPPLNIDKG